MSTRPHDEPTAENPEWTAEMFARARPGREVLPPELFDTKASSRFQVYAAADGWRWRLLLADGQAVAVGGPYSRREDCEAAVRAVQETSASTPVQHLSAA